MKTSSAMPLASMKRAGGRGGLVLRLHVGGGTGRLVLRRELEHRDDVQEQRGDQDDARGPKSLPLAEHGLTDDAQEVPVDVDLGDAVGIGAHEGLEVAGHVPDHEAEQHDPRDRHDDLLSQHRAVETGPGHEGAPGSGRAPDGKIARRPLVTLDRVFDRARRRLAEALLDRLSRDGRPDSLACLTQEVDLRHEPVGGI